MKVYPIAPKPEGVIHDSMNLFYRVEHGFPASS
jgi:hypothetical protein